MEEKNTGGPAFPRQHVVADANNPFFKAGDSGMTLRDYFAAKALGGMLADPNVKLNDGLIDHVAVLAYEVADAMLAARGAA